MLYTIDTSVYVSAFINSDVNHNKALNLLDNIDINCSILVPYVILSEVLTVLTYKKGYKLSKIFWEYLNNDLRFNIVDTDVRLEINYWHKNIASKISFNDMICVYIAKQYDAELITFDEKQMKVFHKMNNYNQTKF